MESLRRTEACTAVQLTAAVRESMLQGVRAGVADGVRSPDYVAGFTRAVEFVAAQAGCSDDDAIDLMLDRSVAEGSSLGDLALAVIEGRIRFDR